MKDLHCLRCKTAEKIPAHNTSNTTAADCSAAVFLLPDIWYLIDQVFIKGLPTCSRFCTTWIFNIARRNDWDCLFLIIMQRPLSAPQNPSQKVHKLQVVI